MNNKDYDEKLQEELNDKQTIKQLKREPVRSTETQLNKFSFKLFQKQTIFLSQNYHLRSSDALTLRLYGLPKLRKPGNPLRPIVSVVNSPTYNLA